MKRSEINAIIDHTIDFLHKHDIKLPPFGYWTPDQWQTKGSECEEIFDDLTTEGTKISRATVYRTLDVLAKYEYIRKMDIGDGRIRYEKKIGTSHHDHMICIETGDIIEFHNQEIEDLQDDIAKKHGYEVVRHVHQLFVKPIKK